MRLWFYAAFIQIEFAWSLWSFHWNYTIKYSFICSDILLLSGSFEYVRKFWVYSVRFWVINLKLLCETLKNEKWKILAWYPKKMWWYCQQNPKCSNWCWTNFQIQVALHYSIFKFSRSHFFLPIGIKIQQSRVFQMVVRGGGVGIPEIYWGDYFTRWRDPKEDWFWWFKPFSKLKKLSVNAEHQLKSKLSWPVCSKSITKNGAGTMTTAKNTVFIGL